METGDRQSSPLASWKGATRLEDWEHANGQRQKSCRHPAALRVRGGLQMSPAGLGERE